MTKSEKTYGVGYDWYADRDTKKAGTVVLNFTQSLSDKDWETLLRLVQEFDRKRRTLVGA